MEFYRFKTGSAQRFQTAASSQR